MKTAGSTRLRQQRAEESDELATTATHVVTFVSGRKTRLVGHVFQICIKYAILGRPRAKETYCRDETDPIELSGGSDFVADC